MFPCGCAWGERLVPCEWSEGGVCARASAGRCRGTFVVRVQMGFRECLKLSLRVCVWFCLGLSLPARGWVSLLSVDRAWCVSVSLYSCLGLCD